jgi:hypothetical protein
MNCLIMHHATTATLTNTQSKLTGSNTQPVSFKVRSTSSYAPRVQWKSNSNSSAQLTAAPTDPLLATLQTSDNTCSLPWLRRTRITWSTKKLAGPNIPTPQSTYKNSTENSPSASHIGSSKMKINTTETGSARKELDVFSLPASERASEIIVLVHQKYLFVL